MPKIMSTDQLVDITEKARKGKANRLVPKEVIDRLDPQGIHMVISHHLADDFTVRTYLMVKVNGTADPVNCVLDMPLREFNELPVYDRTQTA